MSFFYGSKPNEPIISDDITGLKKELLEMYFENTGIALTDSGGVYGRGWEKSRKAGVEAILSKPEMSQEIWSKEDWSFTADTFNFLNTHLDTNEVSDKLNRIFNEYSEFEENKSTGWLQLMESFSDHLAMITAWNREFESIVWEDDYNHYDFSDLEFDLFDFEFSNVDNTYNYDNILDKILQFVTIKSDECSYQYNYIMLQLHNGCDARGGYTKPKIFSLIDYDHFIIGMYDLCLTGQDGKKFVNFSSDDSGYHWYFDGGTAAGNFEKGVDLVGDKEKECVFWIKKRKNRFLQKLLGSKRIPLSIGSITTP